MSAELATNVVQTTGFTSEPEHVKSLHKVSSSKTGCWGNSEQQRFEPMHFISQFGLSSHQDSHSSSAEGQLIYEATIFQVHWFRNLRLLSLDRHRQGNFAGAGPATRGGSQ